MEQRVEEEAIRREIEAAGDGPSTLDKSVEKYFKWSPLHVAASRGQTEEVRRLLNQNPDLIDVLDSRHWSALHLASAKGHVETVQALIATSPEMCSAVDRDGRNPVHIAALKGKVAVLTELVRASPHAARAELERGETILHLCLRHKRLDCLHILLQMIRDQEFVNAKGSGGNTILHLAVADKQLEIVKHILENCKIDANTTNAYRHTAMDILFLAKSDSELEDLELLNRIERILRKANAKRGKELVHGEWVAKKRDILMVVASLIATMAFQAVVSPPGGVWQEDSVAHKAGKAIMAYNSPKSFALYIRFNTVAFAASLSMILLLVSGLPFKKRAFMWVLIVVMWWTITFMAITYAYSIVVVTPRDSQAPTPAPAPLPPFLPPAADEPNRSYLLNALSNANIIVAIILLCSVVALLLLVCTGRLVANVVRQRRSRNKATERISSIDRQSKGLQNSCNGIQMANV